MFWVLVFHIVIRPNHPVQEPFFGNHHCGQSRDGGPNVNWKQSDYGRDHFDTGQKIEFFAILECCIGIGSVLRLIQTLSPSAPFDVQLSVDTGTGKILG
tara:strand:- start:4952 stop:5248 length:297 start_codon:yes stop_codon:yes gene_type:complete